MNIPNLAIEHGTHSIQRESGWYWVTNYNYIPIPIPLYYCKECITIDDIVMPITLYSNTWYDDKLQKIYPFSHWIIGNRINHENHHFN